MQDQPDDTRPGMPATVVYRSVVAAALGVFLLATPAVAQTFDYLGPRLRNVAESIQGTVGLL